MHLMPKSSVTKQDCKTALKSYHFVLEDFLSKIELNKILYKTQLSILALLKIFLKSLSIIVDHFNLTTILQFCNNIVSGVKFDLNSFFH